MKIVYTSLFLFLMSSGLYAQCDRQKIVDDYLQFFEGSQVSTDELGWTGAVVDNSCTPGTISDLAYERTLMRINYFRELVGVPTKVTWDEELNQQAQEAATLMKANNDLSHDPPETWKCYTTDGAKAAGRSNLALGTHSSTSIHRYIQDRGTNNGAVGHRRWILYPRATIFGLGSTDRSQALWVIAKTQQDPGLDFTAYPPNGMIPKPLIFDRWSFSKAGANFKSATVTMWDEQGNELNLEQLEVENGYADNTLVWEPEYDNQMLRDEFDHHFTVHIEQVIYKGDTLEYTYDVMGVTPTFPPTCQGEQIWDTQNCQCASTTTSNSDVIQAAATRIYPNPASSWIQLVSDLPLTNVAILDASGGIITPSVSVQADGIDISSLPVGIYFLQAESTKTVEYQRFIKI